MKALVCGLAAVIAFAIGSAVAQAAPRLEIKVLSSPRPDLVSGGDALVEVVGTTGADEAG